MARRGTYNTFTTATPPVKQTLVTANGNYPLKIQSGTAGTDLIDWQGGRGAFFVTGTFDSASVKLQMLAPDGATWLDVGVAITANGYAVFEAPAAQLRAIVASIVTASSLTLAVVGIPVSNGG